MQLGPLLEWLIASGMGYQCFDPEAIIGHFGANDVDDLRVRQT